MNPEKSWWSEGISMFSFKVMYNQQWDDRLLRDKITTNNQSYGMASLLESKGQ
jgi:hypothetical protein